MSKLKTFSDLLRRNKRGILTAAFNYVVKTGLLNCLCDESFLKIVYWIHFGRKLDLQNPKTFNEKIHWLKIYNRNPLYTKLVDKYEVKKYVASKIGAEHVVENYGVWNSFDEIEFDKLPNQFVLKCTHDSGSVVICTNKEQFDYCAARKKLEKGMKRNLFYWGREWAYKDVLPRIIAEEYITADGSELLDYKLMCFNGRVKCSFICSDRFSDKGLHVTFFDRDWNLLPFERHYPMRKEGFAKPQHYEKMIALAETLAEGMPFVRVDLFEANDKIYLGELTFYPGNGMEEFNPDEWDYKLGSWLELPNVSNKE